MNRTLALLCVLPLACQDPFSKVPIFDVEAGFTLADVSWFEEEQTMFVFYEVSAEQGIGPPTVIEISYATDTERVDWTELRDLSPVHIHLPVDCGAKSLCGSTSFHVPIEPREVRIRLRYHIDSELALDAPTVFNVVDAGDPHDHRSLLVYGVFEATNQRIQWRARHQFPTIRNQQATDLGLRREFIVRDQRYGNDEVVTEENPYGYGNPCPADFVATDVGPVQTNQRAEFSPDDLPLDANDAPTVCGESTVFDALGTFTTNAVALKNPEVRPAFPVLRSPVEEALQLKFFLEPCNRTISVEHEEMQRQRTLTSSLPSICIDEWESPQFEDNLVAAFTTAIEAQRPIGRDMVLMIGLHRDQAGAAAAVERALANVVPIERHRSTPRLVGAFLFDSVGRGIEDEQVAASTLWCPARPNGGGDNSQITCPVQPDFPGLNLGPFSFNALPILPERQKYLDFIEEYGVAQAGTVEMLTVLAPAFTATTDHVDFGVFGVATFLNGELISADADDAFSYCAQEDSALFTFRSAFMTSPAFAQAIEQGCAFGQVPAEICQAAQTGVLTLDWLPEWHNQLRETSYDLGLFWDFPFLLRMNYRAVLGGSVSAFGLSVPFGFGNPAESYYGTGLWLAEEFPLDEQLLQCKRFCSHPTFDGAGVYHPTERFRETYASNCFNAVYPVLGSTGFPSDP